MSIRVGTYLPYELPCRVHRSIAPHGRDKVTNSDWSVFLVQTGSDGAGRGLERRANPPALIVDSAPRSKRDQFEEPLNRDDLSVGLRRAVSPRNGVIPG